MSRIWEKVKAATLLAVIVIGLFYIVWLLSCIAPDQGVGAALFTEQQKAELRTIVQDAVVTDSVTGTGRDVKMYTGGLIGIILAIAVGLMLLSYSAGKLLWLFFGGAKRRWQKSRTNGTVVD